MRPVRRGVVAIALIGALVPLSVAHAERAGNDGNQAAIDAARADQQWLVGQPWPERGVVLSQREIQNAQAIARLLSYDPHAQSEIPNSMEQYRLFCASAVQRAHDKLVNAQAMLAARPWDLHAQAEVANAEALNRMLWATIGDSYPGNPYLVQSPAPAAAAYADDQAVVADEGIIASDDETASDAGVDAGVADDSN